MSSEALSNLEKLQQNPYPGRGIVVGLNDDGQHIVQVYWIMGRSENSRNRVFSHVRGRLFTEAADPMKVKDPKLIIYNAMDEARGWFVVSNGAQTDDVVRSVNVVQELDAIMRAWEYEPDAPNFTPRITATCAVHVGHSPCAEISVLRKSRWGNGCDRNRFFFDEIGRGVGFCVTTYLGDGDPLPAFCGEPYLLPLSGDIETVAETFWDSLNAENRVSLAVKFIDRTFRTSTLTIINKYTKV